MVVVTGAAGFIGSCLATSLASSEHLEVAIADDFSREDKRLNLSNVTVREIIDRTEFFNWFKENGRRVQFVFHIGARTDTTETDEDIFEALNLSFSKKVWSCCVDFKIPMIYASSAATYGSGELGFSDDHSLISRLKPLNAYGDSKQKFDRWVLKQTVFPPKWAGLKFFNVYGPNEYHKGRMASVVFHSFHQIMETGTLKLFKSHNDDYEDGGQLRDFIYVKDVVDVLTWLMENEFNPGIFNLGTGKARTFKDLGTAVFHALGKSANIEYINTPEDIRGKYQYFTQAEMEKLRLVGYSRQFTSLGNGIEDYVKNYLVAGEYF